MTAVWESFANPGCHRSHQHESGNSVCSPFDINEKASVLERDALVYALSSGQFQCSWATMPYSESMGLKYMRMHIGTLSHLICSMTGMAAVMCQHFSGHKVTQLSVEFRNRLVTNNY